MTGGSSRTSRRQHEPGPREHRPGWSESSRVSTIAPVHARVEYVTTSDGVRIAYARRGRGPAVVWMPPFPARHVELEWEQPGDRRWLEWLASRYTLVQYDPRGLGLSDRSVTSFSLEAFERDLHAVIERAAGDGAILFAKVNSGALAISYAVHHPELVSNLVLWCATPRFGEGIGSHLDGLVALAERDWDLFVHASAHLVRGWSAGESAEQLASLLRASLSPEIVPALIRDALPIDVTDQLQHVRSRTLVLHRRGITWVPMERAVQLASTIPGARLVLLEGASMALWSGGMSDAIHAFEDFLGATASDQPATEVPSEAFRYEGDYWTLAFGGRLCRLHDAKGLHHIAYLLGRPGQYVAASDLLAALERGAGGSDNGPTAGPVGDAGPVLDVRARASYRRRLEELRASLDEAERYNDAGRAAAARREMEFIEDQLAAAVGLWGRDRRAASVTERARLTVTKRIKGVLERIGRRHPALGEHLTRTIRTGVLCAYLPEADEATHWVL
jgi:pimeloyl-ACP methyl ester carboxylesterase